MDSREFYDRYRSPDAFNRYIGNEYLLGSPESPNKPAFTFQCFCFVPIDIISILNLYSSNSGSIEADRNYYINGQEEEYSKEMSKRGVPKNYGETFKDQQKRFFKSYVQKFNSWYEHGKRTSYYEHKERFLSEVKNTAERFDATFEKQIANSVVFNFLTKYKANPRNTAIPTKYVGDLTIGQQLVRNIPPNNYGNYDLVKSLLERGELGALHQFHVRNIYNYLKKPSSNLNDYLTDRYIKQYDNEYNLYKRFAFQSAYMIDHFGGHHLTPHNMNRINNKYDFSGYMTHVPYDRVAITNFYNNSKTNSNYSMSFEKAKAIMAINSFPSTIKRSIEMDGTIKNSVINYLENAIPMHYELNTIRDAFNSRNSDAFKWSELPYFRTISFQKRESPETIMSVYLEKTTLNHFHLRQYGIEGSLIFDLGPTRFAYNMHKGIGDVLKKMYENPIYAGKEGATIRHFLKEKGLNVPSSLSNHDLGRLFDFGGGNTNYLTIEFSDYAKKYILNYHHGDGIYGKSLFTDPFKLQALEEILKENTVDFQNEIIIDPLFKSTKEFCVLQELIKMNNNLLKRVSNQFTRNKSQFRLKFTAYNNPSDHAHMRTGLNKENPNIVEIKLNLSKKGGRAIDLASSILHEAIHAELHRIYLSGNKAPYNYSREHYAWLMDLYEFYQNDKNPANNAHHFFMSTYHINPLAEALRDFDNKMHPLENYKYLAWDGLYNFGKAIGLINRSEFDRLERLLSQTVYSDSYESNCN